MQLPCSKRTFRTISVAVIFCLISVLVFHAVDFSHVHPGEIIPHEHKPALLMHAEEKSLWLLLIILASIAVTAFFFRREPKGLRAPSLPSREREFFFARERTRVPLVFIFGVNPQLE